MFRNRDRIWLSDNFRLELWLMGALIELSERVIGVSTVLVCVIPKWGQVPLGIGVSVSAFVSK